MKLTKNQIYIISAVVVIAIIYWFFFRKANGKAAAKMATAPAAPATPAVKAESGWAGAFELTKEQQMASVDGNRFNSVAGTMGKSGLRGDATVAALESGYGTDKNWLGY
jgi:hypothetical protein